MENTDSHNTQRHRKHDNDNVVDDEVQKLFRSNKDGSSEKLMKQLQSKHNDHDLVSKIQKKYIEKHTSILKKAKKFARLIRDKYSNDKYPFHVLLEKAQLFKAKHKLTNDEFHEFQKIYEQELVGLKSSDAYVYVNNMMSLLGNNSVSGRISSGKLNDQDFKYLQEIIKLAASSKVLHAQVFLQSIQYTDCSFNALSGKYDPNVKNPLDHIHPVVAAMFLPKIKELEHHFILSNLSNVIKAKYNNEPIGNLSDSKLLYALITDPNDVVCDIRSPVMDLLNRCNVQNHLWHSVLNLRNGQYYGSGFRDFISGVDMCKLNKYDNPDLVYGRYDGTVIKRLLASFSFRPTVLACANTNASNFSTNPYQNNMRPVVSAVPMINLRLNSGFTTNPTPVHLSQAVNQPQLLVENGMLVRTDTSIIYSNDVLFFFVDRRAASIVLNDLKPFNMGKLPVSISGFERLNDQVVDFSESLTIRSDVYKLRSVVLSEVNNESLEKNLVVGSSAVIITYPKGYEETQYLYYNPLGVVHGYENTDKSQPPLRNDPITLIPYAPQVGWDQAHTFKHMAQTRGIIFMYQLAEDNTKGELNL